MLFIIYLKKNTAPYAFYYLFLFNKETLRVLKRLLKTQLRTWILTAYNFFLIKENSKHKAYPMDGDWREKHKHLPIHRSRYNSYKTHNEY